ncbi:hypothetical protein PP914_gp157 [Arthrobacter phage Qui]|jgi:hypothetical protein|uniref:Uncharacterized protein n=1 Tax=Arthrobacter phage Qui TaxID=2603260 RepID=A0A5B8WK88_9CAUD|nr:hypothetical protein PP914_gp157 [Arthrobacter phage Qui]QED11646.1 hypothetical protein SEA_QUI_157 [Arthrobacter phage Qui]QOC56477.1 hypothetical protein SEA_PAELLA_157 [Arthrobacter phage Paella]
MCKVWALLGVWFGIWFLIRLLGWSYGWNDNDWVWTLIFLVATIFCVSGYQMNKKEVR